VWRVAQRSRIARAAAAIAVLALASGCGGATGRDADADADATARASAPTTNAQSCAAAVIATLLEVGGRVYHEGVSSERTASARALIGESRALSLAVESGDARAAHAAAEELIATGHMVKLTVLRGGRELTSAGAAHALAPLEGSIVGASGAVVGRYLASVWSEEGLIDELHGVTGAQMIIRRSDRTLHGKRPLSVRTLPVSGMLARGGAHYAFSSFPAAEFPAGSPARVFLLRSLSSMGRVCGDDVEDTTVNTLAAVLGEIYRGEGGTRARVEMRRVQRSAMLLRAVAARDPVATRAAISALLNQHIVRMRVYAQGTLLADVGGPYVLAPVSGALRSHGRTIGRFVLSIQDDEGYLRLARRLAGVDVLMYMGSTLVKNSLGPAPGAVPEEGSFRYRGRAFRTVTVHAAAFPSGPLRIIALIPEPYT
jgi:hypothetical protein